MFCVCTFDLAALVPPAAGPLAAAGALATAPALVEEAALATVAALEDAAVSCVHLYYFSSTWEYLEPHMHIILNITSPTCVGNFEDLHLRVQVELK